jgi:hypothetical protein
VRSSDLELGVILADARLKVLVDAGAALMGVLDLLLLLLVLLLLLLALLGQARRSAAGEVALHRVDACGPISLDVARHAGENGKPAEE